MGMKDPYTGSQVVAAVTIQRVVRGWLVRRSHTEFFRKIKYRKYIIREIINFENTYIKKLSLLIEQLKKPLLKHYYRKIITVDKVNQLFANIEDILQLHIKLVSMFDKPPPCLIGSIYMEFIPQFTTYLPYVKNYNNAFKIYSSLVDNEDFSSLIESFGYLPSYLILPIQQTPRYVLLFSDLLKHTNLQNQDYDNLVRLIDTVKVTASSINECLTSNDNEEDTHDLPRRPASASSNRKPRNSIAIHKKAFDAVLSGNIIMAEQDYANIPSYLRPTFASNGWSRTKTPPPARNQWRPTSQASPYHDVHKMTKSIPRPPSPLPKPNFCGGADTGSSSSSPRTMTSTSTTTTTTSTTSISTTPMKLTKANKSVSSESLILSSSNTTPSSMATSPIMISSPPIQKTMTIEVSTGRVTD
ncbi:hypothetical protein SAMD00019534_117400 [Acytostelium subglobosum LB1]|uniref:hypothetical protein n=1 Tax=Acytostelium subglobosum LB1 TaxID=1410327 RepID=UPI000644F544|nr:hypothetical protein SAMD00019534_117400 [Acytostelium subglobosum LB1]GAM28564.1 hypothetical protein SAMD00019534_117400 [Acytostelium subglobosum LB1]|eukprot:XP_012748603.1 hypothetical protein SAMD00019534_117400 [Acytostelium subglobosum LB1]